MNTAVFGARAAMVVAGLGAALGLAGLVSAGPRAPERPGSQERAYDADASRAKLERIHRALSLYRQEHGVKPVAEWRTMADAGLPPHPMVFAMVQGKPWSLPKDTFVVEGSDHPTAKPGGFTSLWVDSAVDKKTNDKAIRYLGRGESLIYLVDENFDPWQESKRLLREERRFRGLALRLDGTIEVVEVGAFDDDGWYGG